MQLRSGHLGANLEIYGHRAVAGFALADLEVSQRATMLNDMLVDALIFLGRKTASRG